MFGERNRDIASKGKSHNYLINLHYPAFILVNPNVELYILCKISLTESESSH